MQINMTSYTESLMQSSGSMMIGSISRKKFQGQSSSSSDEDPTNISREMLDSRLTDTINTISTTRTDQSRSRGVTTRLYSEMMGDFVQDQGTIIVKDDEDMNIRGGLNKNQ